MNVVAVVLLIFGIAGGIQPTLEWKYGTEGMIYASPILADLNGDHVLEVLVAASRDMRMLCSDGKGKLLWDYRIDDGNWDGIQATPSAIDYDGDGKQEVFFATAGGTAVCLDYQGHLRWRSALGDAFLYTGPILADINGDGAVEVILSSDTGTLYCLDDCGAVLWRHEGAGQIGGIPAISFDAATDSYRIYSVFADGVVECLDAGGSVVWSQEQKGKKKQDLSGAVVGDIDGDGKEEVVWAAEGFEIIVNDAATGAEKWRWKAKDIDHTTSFALANFGDAPGLDILCGDASDTIYRVRDGKSIWATEIKDEANGGVEQGPSVGDVDGDGALEVLVCSRANKLVCLDAEGKEKWSYSFDAAPITTPALGDVDGDGQTEIIVTGSDMRVHCLSVGGKYVAERMPWPMLNHDAQLSGNIKGAVVTITAPTGAIRPAARFRIPDLQLKIGTNSFALAYSNDASYPRRLDTICEIANPQGQVTTRKQSGRLTPHEEKELTVDFATDDSGKYAVSAKIIDANTDMVVATDTKEAAFDLRQAARNEIELANERIKKLMDVVSKANPAVGRRAAKTWADAERASQEFCAALSDATDVHTILGRHDELLMRLQDLESRINLAARMPANGFEFAAVSESPLRKIFRDKTYIGCEAKDNDEVTLARNESECAQIVVVPLWKDLKNLKVTAGTFKNVDGKILPPEGISIYSVGYVKTCSPEYWYKVEKHNEWPDPSCQWSV